MRNMRNAQRWCPTRRSTSCKTLLICPLFVLVFLVRGTGSDLLPAAEPFAAVMPETSRSGSQHNPPFLGLLSEEDDASARQFFSVRLNSFGSLQGLNRLSLRGGSATTYNNGAMDAEGTSVFQVIEVPADRIGVLIGRAGSTIKELGRLAGCKIWVDPQTNVPGYPIRYVNVQGPLSKVEDAKRLIRERVENHGAPASDGVIRDTVQVPDHVVGAIIGKGGSGIKSITAMTGARIFIPGESPPGSTERTLTISGSPAMVAHAKQLILGRVPAHQHPATQPPYDQPPGVGQYGDQGHYTEAPSLQHQAYAAQAGNTYGYQGEQALYPPVGRGDEKQHDMTADWREMYASVEQQQQQQQHQQQQQQLPQYQGYDYAQQYQPRYPQSGAAQPRY